MNIQDYFIAMAEKLKYDKIKDVVVFDPSQDTCQSFRVDFEDGKSIEFGCDCEDGIAWIDATQMELVG